MERKAQARKKISQETLRRHAGNTADARSRVVSREPAPGSASMPSARSPRSIPIPEICKQIAAQTPDSLFGSDRIQYHIDQLNQIEPRERVAMRVHMDHTIRHMIHKNASDIDMGGRAGGGLVWLRINGEKKPDFSLGRYSLDESNLLILNLLNESSHQRLMSWKAADCSYELPSEKGKRQRRFRASAYFDMDYVALNMRAITEEVRSLKSLNFHPTVERGLLFRYIRDGLTLVTGVTGSGKSTTLDAIIDANNDDYHGHIVIIGKPIEYMHDSKKCIVRHREVGSDVDSFRDGIVQSLRQDPDIVVIGEMRDSDTISSALEITDSGHKVFSTLHTSSAVESIDRIIGEYPPEEQNRIRNRLADVLRCIVSQKLCPKVGGGRVLTKEVLWMTPPARAAIKNNNTSEVYQMMWEGWNQGQITLEQDLFRLMRQGLITSETALSYSNNKRRFAQLTK